MGLAWREHSDMFAGWWLNGLDRWIGRGLKRWKDEWEGLVIKYLYGLMDGGWMAG